MTSRDIGLRVTKVREGRGLSTVSLARRVGISQAQISRLENGKQGFRSSTLISIAEALETPPFFFFMSDDEWKTYEAGLEARGPPCSEPPVGQG